MNVRKIPRKSVPVPVDDLQDMWKDVARQYFENQLPPIIIEWSFRLKASTGVFVSQVGPRSRLVSQEERHGAARRIRLSAPLLAGQSEAEIVGTLAHEMIHQWQYDIKKRFPNHGQDFHEIMDRMNLGGLRITVRHSLKQQVEQFSKYLWRCLGCGNSYRRQRRTISSRRHRCGKCQGKLAEILLTQSEVSQPELLVAHPSDFQSRQQIPDDWNPQQLGFEY